MPLIATRGAASVQGFGEFAQSGPVNYIEDVFSTYLYTGTGASLTITNGIDLSGKGGLVWRKSRVNTGLTFFDFIVEDTQRGVGTSASYLRTNGTNQESATGSTRGFISSVNSDGFTITGDTSGAYNYSGTTYASFTFRKQPKFFDIVTYTGNGSASRAINHNLGSVPGCIFVKCTSTVTNWPVYHRGLNNGVNPEQYAAYLNLTNDGTGGGRWANTAPTATQFYVNNDGTVNTNGETYVAYIFAHNAGGFGLTGSDNVITCGSFTGFASINLGWEPQWVLMKATSSASGWYVVDNMRGFSVDYTKTVNLLANSSAAEATNTGISVQATGFTNDGIGLSGTQYIYVAIRRGPMKTPTSGTSVFTPVAYSGNNNTRTLATGITTDLAITGDRNSGGAYAKFLATSRLQGNGYLVTSDTSAEATDATIYPVDTFTSAQTGVKIGTANPINSSSYTFINWSFRRAPGFFDVVCYTGTGANRTVNHNLGVAPELLITKGRTSVGSSLLWLVYSNSLGNNKYLRLNTTAGSLNDPSGVLWNLTTPTSSVFSLGTGATNESGANYVAYLFASVAGVSKVGSYTGTGTTLQVNCGFTNGSRFVLIKRTDTTGDWWVYDSARGIVAGNDPYLFLNTTDAEVTNTDYVDTFSSGFELSSTAPAGLNANGGTYIFLAIA